MGAPKGNCNAAKNKAACRAAKHLGKTGMYKFTERRKAFGKMYAYGAKKREALAKRKKYKPFAGMSTYGRGFAISSGW